jgi:2-polyprenyl-3-methyl-5-hydroxy-6-metoxy-1,4-benzoquinol methylase
MKTNGSRFFFLWRIRSRVRKWIAESPSTRSPQLLLFYYRRFGFLKTLGFGLYDEEFFSDQVRFEAAYADLAEVLYSAFTPKSVCDFGCGNAFLIHFLKGLGLTVKGVECSSAAFTHIASTVKSDVLIADVTQSLALGTFDLAISTEVAEHISKSKSMALVDNVTRHAKSFVFFTAAQPGQWGDGHINCQPKDYWQQLFHAKGWCLSDHLQMQVAREIRKRPRIDKLLPWISQNMLVLVPIREQGWRQSTS